MIRRLQKNKTVVAAALILLGLCAMAVFAPGIARHDPTTIDPAWVLTPPCAQHIFGTDSLGRDLFSRIVYGARISLSVAVVAVTIALCVGITLGSIAGFYGGRVDTLIMRFVDIMLCFPTFFLILAVITFLEPSILNIIIVIGLTSWMGVCRLVRAEVLTLKEREYIAASRLMGGNAFWIITRHLVPNAFAPILVNAALGVGGAVLLESALSFLGIGVQPPTPSWGNLLTEAKSTLSVAWWLTIFPGIFIVVTVLASNLLGEGLRDSLEPRSER